MRKDQVYILVGLVVFSIVAFYSFGVIAKQERVNEKPFFYVVYSSSADMKMNPENPQLAQLQMRNVSDFVVKFVKEPPHYGEKIKTVAFLEHWNKANANSYAHIPPNAAVLVYNDEEQNGVSIPVILSHPRYNSLNNEQLTFTVEFSGKKQLKENQQLQDVALFVEESQLSQDQ